MVAHATESDLSSWLTGSDLTAPSGAAATRILLRASELIDEKVVAWYDADDTDTPTDASVAAALRDATLAQVEQWLSVGEDNALDGYPRDTAAGGVSRRPSVLAPRARAKLQAAGLLTTRSW